MKQSCDFTDVAYAFIMHYIWYIYYIVEMVYRVVVLVGVILHVYRTWKLL